MSDKKKMIFIYNPTSGRGLIRNDLMEILDIFVKAGYEVTVHPTQEKDDALHFIPTCTNDYDLMVCCGGDGTLDEAVTGMMNTEPKIPIGYIPAGSTNDFAASLGIPKNLIEAAKIAVTGKPRRTDIGLFNDDYFVYVAAFGLFTDVSYQTKQQAKNVLGHGAYVFEAAKRLPDLQNSYHLKVEANGEVIEDDFIYGMITNSVSVGGMKNLTGIDVSLDDGVFEVTLVKYPTNPLMINNIITNLIRPIDNANSQHIYSFKTDHIVITGDDEVPWTLDGEYGGHHKEVVLENIHKSIKFIVDDN